MLCRQLQVHQKLTQGFIHIQSLVDPKGDSSGIERALERCIHAWSTQAETARETLWDVERLVEFAEHCMDKESLMQMLQHVRALCISENNNIESFEQSRRTVAMLRILMALSMEPETGMERISSMELLAMKHHIHINFLGQRHTSEENLSTLLALDFVVTHKNDPCFSDAIVQAAQDMYRMLGEDVVTDDAPKRPLSTTFPDLTASIQGGSLNESLQAIVELRGSESFTVARCPMTLFGLVDGGRWECRSCHKNFSIPPEPCYFQKHLQRVPTPPRCPICAGIVGLSKPEWLLN